MDISFSNSNFHSKAYILSSAINTVGCFPWRKSFPPFIFEKISISLLVCQSFFQVRMVLCEKKQLVWNHNSNNFTSAIPPDFFAAEVLSAALPFHYRVSKSHQKKKKSHQSWERMKLILFIVLSWALGEIRHFFPPEVHWVQGLIV